MTLEEKVRIAENERRKGGGKWPGGRFGAGLAAAASLFGVGYLLEELYARFLVWRWRREGQALGDVVERQEDLPQGPGLNPFSASLPAAGLREWPDAMALDFVMRGEGGREAAVRVVGTRHDSLHAAKVARREFARFGPDEAVVELDALRAAQLLQMSRAGVTVEDVLVQHRGALHRAALGLSVAAGGAWQLLAGDAALARESAVRGLALLASAGGTAPVSGVGLDFFATVQEAQRRGVPLVLADQTSTETERAGIFYAALRDDDEAVERINAAREAKMAACVRDSVAQGRRRVLVVVGAGHVPGLWRLLRESALPAPAPSGARPQ